MVKLHSEYNATISEYLGNEYAVHKLVMEDASLAEKIVDKLITAAKSLANKTDGTSKAERKRIDKALKLYLDAAEAAGNNSRLYSKILAHIEDEEEKADDANISENAEKESANEHNSESMSVSEESVDYEENLRYNYISNFKFKHKNFPSETESQSEAHRLAVWWARRKDVEVGDQTLISMNNCWYIVEKFDDAENFYQVEERILNSEFNAIFKEIKANARSGQIKSVQGTFDKYDQCHKPNYSSKNGKSSVDSDKTRYGRKDSELVRVASSENKGRERNSSNGSRDSQSGGENRQGIESGLKYSLKNGQLSALEKRGVKNDDLLNAIDLADEILSVNGVITEDAKAVLYHATSEENALKIIESGKMYGKEDALFFSTKSDGEILGYGESIIEARIPLEKLQLNDVFDKEVHLTMSVKPYTMTNIRYSRKASSDTVTMTKGEQQKRCANYTKEKVYNRQDIENALKNTDAFEKLPLKLRDKYVSSVWQSFNTFIDTSRFNKYLDSMSYKFFADVLRDGRFTDEQTDNEVKFLNQSIRELKSRIKEFE